MALSLITSYQLKSSAAGTTPLVTPSFTPANGEVVTVTWETFDPAISMTITNSGSQTVAQKVLEQPGGFNGTCGINAGTIAGSPGSMTITGTPSASARYSMTVERWGGAQLAATPVNNGNTSTTGAAQSTITPSAGTSVIVWVSQDSQSVDPATRAYAGSGTDDGTRDDHVGANGVGYHGYQSSTGTGSQTYGLTAPIGQKWVICAVEVQATAGAVAVYPPGKQFRRRLTMPPRLPRGRSSTPVRAQQNPPFPIQQVKQPRQLRGFPIRRPRTATPIPAQVIVAAVSYPPRPIRARIRGIVIRRPRISSPPQDQSSPQQVSRIRIRLPRIFRGRASSPVPIQVIAPPVYPPQPIRSKLRGLLIRRPRVSAPPIDQQAVMGALSRRLRLPRLFRGRTVTPVPGQIAVPAPAYPPQSVRTRVRGLRPSRPRSSQVVPPQITLIAPAYVPLSVRTRLRGLKLFRPRLSTPVPAQAAAPVNPPFAPLAVRSGLRGLKLLRPKQAAPPVDQNVAPPAPRRRPPGLPPRRGHSFSPVPLQVAPTLPPAYPLASVRKRLRGILLRRPRIGFPPWPQSENPPAPPIPPTPTPAPNGWYGLLGILKGAREIRDDAVRREITPVACPNDGQPLSITREGILFCRYDGWMPEGQGPIVRSGNQGDWGGLGNVIQQARADGASDQARRWLACPNDGEPLRRSLTGELFCPYDNWRPPKEAG